MGRIFGFYSWNPVPCFFLSLGHTSSKGTVNLYYYYYFSFVFEDLVILRNLSILKVHFYLLFFFLYIFLFWGLSLHEVIYIKLVHINRLVQSLQTISWFDMEYLQKKNKLPEKEGCVYTKVQSNCCTFIAYVIRLILIIEAVLYQISGLCVTPGGL